MPRPLISDRDRARLESERSDRSETAVDAVTVVEEASTLAGKHSTDAPPPCSIDEPLRDDHVRLPRLSTALTVQVYEAFVDEPVASTSGAAELGRTEAPGAGAQDCPRAEESGEGSMLSPSAAVFHSHTLPLALPAQFTRANLSSGAARSRSPTEPVVQLSAVPTRRSPSPRQLASSPTASEHRAGELLARVVPSSPF